MKNNFTLFLHLVYPYDENIVTFCTVWVHLHFTFISLLSGKHKSCECLHYNTLISDFTKIRARKIVDTLYILIEWAEKCKLKKY